MARIIEPSDEDERNYKIWTASRPPAVRAAAEKLDPWSLYRMRSTGHRVTLLSLSETDPVTVTVNISGEYNLISFGRQVFGIDPDDLEPCDLPNKDEVLGEVLTLEDGDSLNSKIKAFLSKEYET